MKKLRIIGHHLACGMMVLSVAAFIGMDLLRASGFDWQSWMSEIKTAVSEYRKRDEIRNYVEFIKVDFRDLQIWTGIRFDSSSSRKIEQQWCYLEHISQPKRAARTRLDLVVINGDGKKTIHTYSMAALNSFGLNQDDFAGLITSHCRFQ